MVKKKTTKKKVSVKKKIATINKKTAAKAKKTLKKAKKSIPTLNLRREHDIALDFALKVYEKFQKAVKSVILFGSTT